MRIIVFWASCWGPPLGRSYQTWGLEVRIRALGFKGPFLRVGDGTLKPNPFLRACSGILTGSQLGCPNWGAPSSGAREILHCV